MKRAFIIISVFVCSVFVMSCASIVSKSSYPVTFRCQPESVDISIVNGKGEKIFTGKTPTTVTLRAGAGFFKGQKYSVTFSKEGFDPNTKEIKRGVDGWYIAGNFFIGGLIGWLIVDPATGAMWTLPKEVTATLKATQETPSETPETQSPTKETSYLHSDDSVEIVSIEAVPGHLRSRMVKVE